MELSVGETGATIDGSSLRGFIPVFPRNKLFLVPSVPGPLPLDKEQLRTRIIHNSLPPRLRSHDTTTAVRSDTISNTDFQETLAQPPDLRRLRSWSLVDVDDSTRRKQQRLSAAEAHDP